VKIPSRVLLRSNESHTWSRVEKALIIGTGTEVWLCVQAYDQLTAGGIKARVGKYALMGNL